MSGASAASPAVPDRSAGAALGAIPTRVALPLLLVAGGLLLGSELTQGWYPHDEGALGQAAERILAGEVPHRDFVDPYTGLLSYWHALVFSVLPISSVSMRLPLFAAAIGWLALVYRILARFAPPAGAALMGLTVLAWSVPNYPAPMPSWYIVFASTAAALALLRWHEHGGARWLFVAGALAALAFLLKLPGALLLLGCGLALLAVEEPAPQSGRTAAEVAGPGALARGSYAWCIAALLLAAPLALARVAGTGGAEFLRFVVPTSVLSLAIAWRVLRPTPLRDAARWRALAGRVGPLVLGFVVPVALYLGWQAALGALPALVESAFVAPFRRTAFAAMPPPPPLAALFAVPLAGALWARTTSAQSARLAAGLAGLLGVTVLVLSGTRLFWYLLGWLWVWGLLFLLALQAAWTAVRAPRRAGPAAGAGAPATPDGPAIPNAERTTSALLLACIAVSGALIEFPFASPIYVLYGLPLVFLALTALVRTSGRVAPALQVALTVLALAFAGMRVLPAWSGMFAFGFQPTEEIEPLELERGGIRVTPLDAAQFEEMIPLVREKAAGRPIWAGPDAPEVYFYSGIPNRTRTMFDFLDPPWEQARSLVERIESIGAGVVVIKLQPQFSPPPSPAAVASLRQRFPHRKRYPSYLVLWR